MNSLSVTDIPKESKDNAKLVGHLQNADFFDTTKFPTAKLVIKSAKEIAPGKQEVTAQITIKGETDNITFPVEVSTNKDMTTAIGKISVNRTKFGVKYASANFFKLAADRIINDEFDLTFKVVAQNKK
jgi:polyisoprenoid-binding protein YceI